MQAQLESEPVVRQPDPTSLGLSRGKRSRPLFDPPIVKRAVVDSFVKLNPKTLAKNPVMLVVEVGAMLTTALLIKTVISQGPGFGFELQIALWLWFTVVFANNAVVGAKTFSVPPAAVRTVANSVPVPAVVLRARKPLAP